MRLEKLLKEINFRTPLAASFFKQCGMDGRAGFPSHRWLAQHAIPAMQRTLDRFQLGDEVGFDWVTVAEHHFAPFSMTPNPMVMAAALTKVVKRAKIAVLGPDIPILDPEIKIPLRPSDRLFVLTMLAL